MSQPGESEWGLGEVQRVAVVVAHPDDESLWAGGLLLNHPEWTTFILSLCRGRDPGRAPRFHQALEYLGAQGIMGDLEDGPDQAPLPPLLVQDAILSLLPDWDFDLLLTHAPGGEYTHHRRHGEVARAVQALYRNGELSAKRILEFAYEDGGQAYYPRPKQNAPLQLPLTESIWARKYHLITQIYGFEENSWEARTTPRVEAFRGVGVRGEG